MHAQQLALLLSELSPTSPDSMVSFSLHEFFTKLGEPPNVVRQHTSDFHEGRQFLVMLRSNSAANWIADQLKLERIGTHGVLIKTT